LNLSDIKALDHIDPLRRCRDKFQLPKGTIYLDGNSLGALPKTVISRVNDVVELQWGQSLISSWNTHDWISLPSRVGTKIGRLIGAQDNTVICADSTSVNIFKLLSAAVRLAPNRRIILSDTGNFPNDLYIIQGVINFLDDKYELKLVAPEEIENSLTEDVAVAVLTEVDYRTGRRHNMAGLTSKAKSSDIKIIWDLCHSAGAFPVDLAECGVEFAVGCCYKYLNGGPGAPAFLYVTSELQDLIQPPLSGWMGHRAPFGFDLDYSPATGILRNLCGTPGVIAMSSLDAALDIWDDIDLQDVREKSQLMINLFAQLVAELCPNMGLSQITSFPEEQRGSQISFSHTHGYAIIQALIDRGVVGDFRDPDILRFGMTPLYISFDEVRQAVEIFADVLNKQIWDQPKFHRREAVT